MGIVALTVPAIQARPPHKRRVHTSHKVAHKAVHKAVTGAENSLVGISLFDKGIQVISLYGTPDIISPANVVQAGGAGGAPGANGGFGQGGPGPGIRGPGGGGRPRMGPAAGGGGGAAPGADYDDPEDTDSVGLLQQGPGMGPGGRFPGAPGAGGPGMGPGGRYPGAPGAGGYGAPGGAPGAGYRGGPPGGPGAAGAGAGFGGPNSGGGAADNVVYTRWTYFRGASRYAFVFDKFNRVVQIEAIGIDNSKVRTKRGIGFGNNFASLIKTYGAPDGYDIAGDNSLTVRYLLNSKVAFRLSRLGQKKPPVVTGIVIAAAKG